VAGEALSCRGIVVAFEGLRALDGVDLELRRGDILGLIGTNGAGKTTLVNVISGYETPSEGSVSLGDREITGLPPQRLARSGVVRTFQSGRLFPSFTVLETLEVAGVAAGLSRRDARTQGFELLERAGIRRLAEVATGAVSQGQVRIVGVLRALATRPAFMLVDEPAAGSNESEGDQILELLRWIAAEHTAGLLVIEHDMSLIMRLCPRIQVLDHGRTIAIGAPDEVRANPEVIRAYLGSADAVH
jgi:branched-chain amino acid transport system ATP-binding protein